MNMKIKTPGLAGLIGIVGFSGLLRHCDLFFILNRINYTYTNQLLPTQKSVKKFTAIGFEAILLFITKIPLSDSDMGKKERIKKQQKKKMDREMTTQNTAGIRVLNIEEEKKDDLISDLPDEILCRVISLTPFIFAVQTSLLSKRWRNLWKKAFAVCGTIEDIVKATNSFLSDFYKTYSYRKSRRHFLYQYRENGIFLCQIKYSNQLHMDFWNEKHESPTKFDWQLTLHAPASGTGFGFPSSITKLHLSSLDKLTKNEIGFRISKFEFLEKLKITKCSGLSELRIEAGSRLQSLTILDCPDLSDLYVFASGLEKFGFRGRLPRICLKDTERIEDVMLDCQEGPFHDTFSCENLLALLLAFTNVRVLSLYGWLFEVPIQWLSTSVVLNQERREFRFDKLENLWWITNSIEEYRINVLAYFLQLCPSLRRLFITVDPNSYYSPSMTKYHSWRDDTNQVASGLNDLRFVRMEGFGNESEEVLMTQCILQKAAPAEPTIVSISRRFGSKKNCPRRLLKDSSGKAKNRCGKMPMEHEERAYYYFGFVSYIHIKHPHMKCQSYATARKMGSLFMFNPSPGKFESKEFFGQEPCETVDDCLMRKGPEQLT
ncbi:F-box domain [Dillenia turbinata]|uniref:F-box domain n=1 Tax=Dillenia turbinata TaxID=194707 RepID=A0AAN8VGA9_9MAGN